MSEKRLSYSDMFPGRFIHADELDGKAWTLTIDRVYQELLKKKDKNKSTVVAFKETPKEYVLNPTNGAVLVALWGLYADQWEGHRVTIAPTPDPSGRGRSGMKIIFIGSPEMTEPLAVKLPGGLQEGEVRTLKPTGMRTPEPVPANVNATTGEVGGGAASPNPTGGQETAQIAPAAADEDSSGYWPTDADAETAPATDPTFGMDAEQARAHWAAQDAAGPKANALLIGKLKVAGERAGKYPAEICGLADARYGISDLAQLSKRQAEALIAELEGKPESLLGTGVAS